MKCLFGVDSIKKPQKVHVLFNQKSKSIPKRRVKIWREIQIQMRIRTTISMERSDHATITKIDWSMIQSGDGFCEYHNRNDQRRITTNRLKYGAKESKISRLCMTDTIHVWVQSHPIETFLCCFLLIFSISHFSRSQNHITAKNSKFQVSGRHFKNRKCFSFL